MESKVLLRLEVYHISSFLNTLISMKIKMYSIHKNDHYLEILISMSDYDKIKKMKTIKSMKVLHYYGFYGIYFFLRKHFLVFLFLFLGILFQILLSFMIFDVEIVCSNQVLVKKVSRELNQLGISKYHFQLSFDQIQKVKEKLLFIESQSIEWLEIERKGTKYIVRIEEKKINTENDSCLFRDVVSLKNAIITKVYGEDGELVKRKGDYVSKGEVIISGEIHNGDDVVSKRCAKGEVYGEVWYRVSLSFPKKIVSSYYTSKSTFGLFFQLGKKQYTIHSKYSLYDMSSISVLSSSLYPFQMGIGRFYEKKEKVKNISLSNIDEEAYLKGEKVLKKKIGNDVSVIRKKILKKEIKNSKIIIEVFFSVEENITDYAQRE